MSETQKNNTKKYMALTLGAMFLASLLTGWIMGRNLNMDSSKERFKLTKDYKKIKKLTYVFDKAKGEKLYLKLCSQCHGNMGLGTIMTPPLASSELLMGDFKIPLKVITRGLYGEIERNEKIYNSVMPSFKKLSHMDIAHVTNFIRNSFGNKSSQEVHPVEVVTVRIDTLSKKKSFKENELGITKTTTPQ